MSGLVRLQDYLKGRVAGGDFPGASYLVAEGTRVIAEGAVGLAVARPETIPATTSTLYDLASLTKPFAGALLAARLSQAGRMTWDDTVARHLPGEEPEGGVSRVTLLDLLTHRSGLPAWRPVYIHASGREGFLRYLQGLALERTPGSRVVYSDPGYMLLGFVLERAGGARLDSLFAESIAAPLALADLLYCPGASLRRRIAATEEGNRKERLLAGREGDRYNGWSAQLAWGEVHDLNARALGGVSAHAGLFGTTRSLFALAREILGPGTGLLEEPQRELLMSNLTAGLGEDRTLGFVLASSPGSAAGHALSSRSFGHTGFTGTSLWIDPDALRTYILLTNRVHPEFREMDMNAVRRGFHDIAAAL